MSNKIKQEDIEIAITQLNSALYNLSLVRDPVISMSTVLIKDAVLRLGGELEE